MRIDRWQRVNGDPFEYAIHHGVLGDEFVRLIDGSLLRREVTFQSKQPNKIEVTGEEKPIDRRLKMLENRVRKLEQLQQQDGSDRR